MALRMRTSGACHVISPLGLLISVNNITIDTARADGLLVIGVFAEPGSEHYHLVLTTRYLIDRVDDTLSEGIAKEQHRGSPRLARNITD